MPTALRGCFRQGSQGGFQEEDFSGCGRMMELLALHPALSPFLRWCFKRQPGLGVMEGWQELLDSVQIEICVHCE